MIAVIHIQVTNIPSFKDFLKMFDSYMSCTIVSALYPIRSKFKLQQYVEWGKTFMKLENPIVLFTEASLVPTLQELRENRPITFVVIPFEELDTWKLYRNEWIEQHKLDPENSYHTPELYSIWAEKIFFVEKAIRSNYFQTDYFFWCDFGAFRDPAIHPTILQSFPRTKYFQDDKLLMQGIGDMEESDKIIDADGLPLPSTFEKVRLVGGLWGGSSIACLRWKENYQTMLECYFEKGRFAGKDQTVMLSTYLCTPDIATIVKHTTGNEVDSWFFMEHLLSDLPIVYETNKTYFTSTISTKPMVYLTVMGGLGHQLFQIATAYTYAKKQNVPLAILSTKLPSDDHPLYWDSILLSFQKYRVKMPINGWKEWQETEPLKYSPIPSLPPNGIHIKGYFQTPNYFSDPLIVRELKQHLLPSEQIMNKIKQKYKHILENKQRVIVVHAKKTDEDQKEESTPFHEPLTKEYYLKAIKDISVTIQEPIFVLSSQEPSFWIPWIRDIPELREHRNVILFEEDDITTFALLQQFHYFVISHSSDSWWTAWLSADPKKVIAPVTWSGSKETMEHYNRYMPEWKFM